MVTSICRCCCGQHLTQLLEACLQSADSSYAAPGKQYRQRQSRNRSSTGPNGAARPATGMSALLCVRCRDQPRCPLPTLQVSAADGGAAQSPGAEPCSLAATQLAAGAACVGCGRQGGLPAAWICGWVTEVQCRRMSGCVHCPVGLGVGASPCNSLGLAWGWCWSLQHALEGPGDGLGSLLVPERACSWPGWQCLLMRTATAALQGLSSGGVAVLLLLRSCCCAGG